MMSFKWIATAAAAVALLGCGGQDGDAGTAAAAVSVQVDTVPAGLKVTTSLADGAVLSPGVHETTQYAFSATIASGPDAGQSLSGTLVLQAQAAIGSSTLQVQGTLVRTARIAATPAALATFDTRTQSLRATLRAQVEAASAGLLDAMKAGADGSTLSPAQSRAIALFTKSFTALDTTYRSDVAALNALLLAESADGDVSSSDTDLEVSGVASTAGRIILNLELADLSLRLSASGTTAADGSMSGDLTGPGGDLGTWTAAAQPMPPAAAIGNVGAGLAKYGTYCANCHTDNVRRNEFNVVVGSDVARLNAALAGIGSMTFLDPVLSAQDRLDLVAYVLSAQ